MILWFIAVKWPVHFGVGFGREAAKVSIFWHNFDRKAATVSILDMNFERKQKGVRFWHYFGR